MTVWMDQGGIEGATLWAQEITHAIRRAKVCLLFGTAASFSLPTSRARFHSPAKSTSPSFRFN